MKNYKKQIYLFLYVSLFIVISSFAVLFFNFRKQVRLQNEILKIETNLIQADSLTANLLQIESDKRGFQLTSDADYLKNYYSLKMNAHGNVAKLKKNSITVADTEILSQVDSLLKMRIANLDSGIVVFTTKGLSASIAFMEIRGKKVIREQLNQKLNLLKNHFLQRLKENTTGINSRSNRNLTGLLILLSIFVALMLVAARRFRRAQQKIIKNHIKFKEAQRIAKIGSWEWDIVTNRLIWSQEQFRLFGKDRKKIGLTYEDYLDHLSEKEQENTKALIKDALEGKANYAVEHEIIRKDGKTLMVFEQGTVLFDEDNKPTGMFGTTQDITERKLAEQAQRTSEQRYRQIVETAQEGIWVLDENNYTIFVNKKMCEMLEYTREEMMGKQNYYFKDDEGKEMAMKDIERRKNGITETQFSKFIAKSGKIIWTTVSTNPIFDDGGKYAGALGMFTDITERKSADEELVEAQKKIQQIFDNTTDGIYQSTIDGKFIMANPAMARIFGYDTPAELIGDVTNIGDQIYADPADRKRMSDILSKQDHLENFEVQLLTKKKQIIWVSESTRIVRDEKGDIKCFEGTLKDITEHKKAEEELLLAQKRFQAIFDNTADGIYQSTVDGKFIIVNPSMARIFGYDSPDELIQSVTDIGTQIYADPVERKKMTAIILAEGHIENYELQVLRKNNDTIWVSANIRIVRDEKGNINYFEGTLEDITKQKIAEEEILQLNKNLDQFANITAHDLQEPIRMVSGFLGLLDKKYSDVIDEQGKSYIYRAKDGADRMSTLIKDLLEFSRSGNKAAKKEPVDLASVMDLVNKDLTLVVADTKAILNIPASLPVVTGTQSALYRLFLNLISNGIKFRKKDTAPEVTLSVNELPCCWEFALQDNGIGVAEKDQPKLFQAFQRLHRREEYPGTGLGLVTCKKIVETHGGKIGMTSEWGKGTVFHFTIPK